MTCSYCDAEFQRNTHNQKYCSKECYSEMHKMHSLARYYNDPDYKEKLIGGQREKRYGVSTDKYIEMLEAQNYRCAICGRHQEELDRRMSVDHDHDTGSIRELLCNSCNVGIGHLQDDPALIRKAIEYLEKHQ